MIFRVEKTKDYTVMSNHHLRDKNLSLKGKGMLSLMLSLPDDWDYTLTGLAYICKDGVSSIRTTVAELEQYGYLSRRRLRNEKGQLGDTEYIIHEKPQKREKGVDSVENPVDKSPPECEKPICGNPTLDNLTLEKPALEYPTLENGTQLNTNQHNTDSKSTKKINTDVVNTYQSITRGEPPIDEIDKFNRYREVIYKNIEYDILCERCDREKLDEIVEIMLDHICGKSDSVRIGKTEFPAEVVKSRLLKLDSSHIEYVMDCVKQNTTKVKNIKSYMLTTLYNAPATINHFYTTLVNHDMANYSQKN